MVQKSVASRTVKAICLLVVACAGWFGSSIEMASGAEMEEAEIERILRMQPYPEDGTNAWDRWLELSQSYEGISVQEDDILYSVTTNEKVLPEPALLKESSQILARYQPILSAFELQEREFVGIPQTTDSGGSLIDLHWFRSVARLKTHSASLLWWRGEKGRAFSNVSSHYLIGGSTCRFSTSFIPLLTGVAVRSLAVDRAYWMMSQSVVDEDTIVRALDAMEGGDRDIELGFGRAIRGDHELMLRLWSDNMIHKEQWLVLFSELKLTVAESVVDEFAEFSEQLDLRLLDRRSTRDVYGRALAEVITMIEGHEYWVPRELSRRFEKTIDEWDGDLESFRTNLEKAVSLETESDRAEAITLALRDCPSPLGRIILDMAIPAFEQIGETTQVVVATSRLIVLLMQMGLITSRGEELPDSLPELLPAGYPQTILMDPFSGDFFRYDPLSRTVWSIGRNRIDDDGSAHEKTPALGKDIVMRLGN